MKRWVFLLGIIIVLLAGVFLALSFYGSRFVDAELKKAIGPGITVSEVKIKLTHLSVKGIGYEDPQLKKKSLQIEEVKVYPALFASLKGVLRIRELVFLRPTFFLFRSREGAVTGPLPVRKEAGNEKGTGEKKAEKALEIRIDRLRIVGGVFDFEDRKVEGPPAEIHLRGLDLDVRDIQYPFTSIRSPITLKGGMVGPTKEGEIDAKGWIDFNNLDMETLLKVRGIEVKIFEPYYRKRVSAEIEAGYLNMQAKIHLKNRVVDAPGELELTDIRIREGGGSVLWIPAKTLVSLLRNKGNRIKLDFHVRGNMDDPRFSLQENVTTRIGVSLAEALGIPIKTVGEEVLGGSLKGAKGLAEGLRSIEELFRPGKEKKR